MNIATPINNSVGPNVRRLRKERGLTQKQLGELCDPPIAEANIRKIELGRHNVRIDTLNRVLTALGAELVIVMREEGRR